MKYQLLNNEPLQFFNSAGELIGTIEISGSGDMLIRPESGSSRDIILGNQDTVGDVELGLPSAESTWKFMGGGMISANGNTLTIGDSTSGDIVIFDASVFSGSLSGSFQGDGSQLTGISSGITWVETTQSVDFTAEINKGYLVDSSGSVSGSVILTLPSSPSFGDQVAVLDVTGFASDFNK